MNKAIEDKYGPQSSGDNLFTRRTRLLQSYYRVEKLKEKEFGIGPNKNSVHKIKDDLGELAGETRPSYYGNMLVNGVRTGRNFIYPETFQYAGNRLEKKMKEETIDAYRLFNNMLSSMPLAFNLFHPLMMIKEKYPKELNRMIQDAFPALPVYEVMDIKIEFVPTPINDYTNDKSAMDAAIIFKDENENKHLLAIEVKYTDSLGTNKASDNALKCKTAEDLVQFTDDGLETIKGGCSQIYRNYLLAEKYAKVQKWMNEDGQINSYSIILAPKDHPSTQREIDSLKKFLKPQFQYKIEKSDLELFIETLSLNCPDEFKEWLSEFNDRYLNFGPLEDLLKR
ncbi:MAG: hypothetical protein IPO83_18245 [Chitinophagaceae bacterium]|nr:hypothetical protein [Chitinophagaceae bacterium]